MFEHIENLKLLEVLEGLSISRGDFTCRPSHALIFKLSGTSVYTFAHRALALSQGQMLLLPKGESYRVEKTTHGDSRYVLMNFDGEMAGATPRVYDTDAFGQMGLVRSGLGRMWRLGSAWERYRCMGVFYNALALAARQEQLDYAAGRHLGRIGPGLEHLREHIFDVELRVGRLHELCGVSDTYFRKVFRENYGMSVQQYVAHKRLSQAAAVLHSGDFDCVAGVARSVGYSDPLYFSRAFARAYGCCPSDYARRG
ncbi:MAG: helix-turn-helix transcriptional regulator [Oscillospiraceae bacterium]|nr:helix-turn-helix transcriptional regulator [Oscillospiraceae bacterium]